MFSQNGITLPSKHFYTLKEAAAELNLFFNRSDIDENYVLHLVHQGHIWFYGKFSRDNYLLAIPYEWELNRTFTDENEKAIAEIFLFNHLLNYQKSYNRMGDYDLYLKIEITCAFDFLNNKEFITPIVRDLYDPHEYMHICKENFVEESLYYLEIKEIPENFKLSNFFQTVLINYASRICLRKITWLEVHDAMYKGTDKENVYIETQEIKEIEEFHNNEVERKIEQFAGKEGWSSYYWYGSNDRLDNIKLEFSRDDILILNEDMEILKRGDSRKIRELPGYRSPMHRDDATTSILESEHVNKNSISNKSMNKIIYALAQMAALDLSQPQSTFTRLQAFCDQNGLDLPNKDTCGKAFKNAKYQFDNFDSK